MLDVTRKGAVLRPPKTGVSGVGQFNALRPAPDRACSTARRRSCRSAARHPGLQRLLAADQDGVDDAVLLGLVRRHDLVTVDVLADLVDGLAGVTSDHLLQLGAPRPGQWLVDLLAALDEGVEVVEVRGRQRAPGQTQVRPRDGRLRGRRGSLRMVRISQSASTRPGAAQRPAFDVNALP